MTSYLKCQSARANRRLPARRGIKVTPASGSSSRLSNCFLKTLVRGCAGRQAPRRHGASGRTFSCRGRVLLCLSRMLRATRPHKPSPMANQARSRLFNCPCCGADYHLIKVVAGPERTGRDVRCVKCSTSFNSREGSYILKYFLLGRRRRAQANRALEPPS